MNLEQHINYCIVTYPTLYKDVNHKKSRLKVLNHIFMVTGTEYEWHPDGFLAPYDGSYNIFKLQKELPKDFYQDFALAEFDFTPYPIGIYCPLLEMIEGKTNSLHIDNFEIKSFKSDWIKGAVDIAKEAVAYYNGPLSQHKNHCYYSANEPERWNKFCQEQIKILTKFIKKFE
jgi:hypothetical protein